MTASLRRRVALTALATSGAALLTVLVLVGRWWTPPLATSRRA